MKKAYYKHPINSDICEVELEDKFILKIDNKGIIKTTHSFYLSEPTPLQYLINPFFVSKRHLVNFSNTQSSIYGNASA